MCQVDLSETVKELSFKLKKQRLKEGKRTVRRKLKSMLSERIKTQNFDDMEEF